MKRDLTLTTGERKFLINVMEWKQTYKPYGMKDVWSDFHEQLLTKLYELDDSTVLENLTD